MYSKDEKKFVSITDVVSPEHRNQYEALRWIIGYLREHKKIEFTRVGPTYLYERDGILQANQKIKEIID